MAEDLRHHVRLIDDGENLHPAEHAARMSSMNNASKNAKEMVDSLTLYSNRVRQAAITKELMEIIGGAEAIKA